MKQLEVTIKTLFSHKEQYLLRKQKCFVLDPGSETSSEDFNIDSSSETGPKNNEKWWKNADK